MICSADGPLLRPPPDRPTSSPSPSSSSPSQRQLPRVFRRCIRSWPHRGLPASAAAAERITTQRKRSPNRPHGAHPDSLSKVLTTFDSTVVIFQTPSTPRRRSTSARTAIGRSFATSLPSLSSSLTLWRPHRPSAQSPPDSTRHRPTLTCGGAGRLASRCPLESAGHSTGPRGRCPPRVGQQDLGRLSVPTRHCEPFRLSARRQVRLLRRLEIQPLLTLLSVLRRRRRRAPARTPRRSA